MSTFDTPNISVGMKSNEENIQITKSYLNDLAYMLNLKIDSIEERLSALESAIEKGESK